MHRSGGRGVGGIGRLQDERVQGAKGACWEEDPGQAGRHQRSWPWDLSNLVAHLPTGNNVQKNLSTSVMILN